MTTEEYILFNQLQTAVEFLTVRIEKLELEQARQVMINRELQNQLRSKSDMDCSGGR